MVSDVPVSVTENRSPNVFRSRIVPADAVPASEANNVTAIANSRLMIVFVPLLPPESPSSAYLT